ncbi:hypothetical protein [Spiroplasma endosymbiont of Dilophus febrilis]|uniref:hypothetical protein n=1 Tax=Spiroplasma endosymbiont of Dilophus febrilis TaxID=3066292 RepID=UPI00313C9493
MIQLLLTNGANIHIFNEKKVSPLSIVLSEADERKIKLLRENEINNQMIATKSNSDIRYNNLYFLGDSLSDSGAFIGVAREFNIFNIFKSQEFEAPLYKDFCSNGPTYSQILANKLIIKW